MGEGGPARDRVLPLRRQPAVASLDGVGGRGHGAPDHVAGAAFGQAEAPDLPGAALPVAAGAGVGRPAFRGHAGAGGGRGRRGRQGGRPGAGPASRASHGPAGVAGRHRRAPVDDAGVLGGARGQPLRRRRRGHAPPHAADERLRHARRDRHVRRGRLPRRRRRLPDRAPRREQQDLHPRRRRPGNRLPGRLRARRRHERGAADPARSRPRGGAGAVEPALDGDVRRMAAGRRRAAWVPDEGGRLAAGAGCRDGAVPVAAPSPAARAGRAPLPAAHAGRAVPVLRGGRPLPVQPLHRVEEPATAAGAAPALPARGDERGATAPRGAGPGAKLPGGDDDGPGLRRREDVRADARVGPVHRVYRRRGAALRGRNGRADGPVADADSRADGRAGPVGGAAGDTAGPAGDRRSRGGPRADGLELPGAAARRQVEGGSRGGGVPGRQPPRYGRAQDRGRGRRGPSLQPEPGRRLPAEAHGAGLPVRRHAGRAAGPRGPGRLGGPVERGSPQRPPADREAGPGLEAPIPT